MFKKDPLQIISFYTYGTKSHLYLKGRALEDEDIDLEKKGWLSLLVNSWKRFETDEIRNTPLRLTFSNGEVIEGSTDAEGYYLIKESNDVLRANIDSEGWLSYEVSYGLENSNRKIQLNNRFLGKMLIPKTDSSFGVISDIDDTILHTGVASPLKWQVIINTFFKTPHKRKALEGAAEFYHLLHSGKSKKEANPIFYVSHSPWNLYRYLELFLRQNNFPKGPILLRSMSNFLKKKHQGEKPQKQKEILNLLKTYPDLPFILIGDIGEHDPDIYMEIAEEFPDRILAIYLRSVKHKKKMIRVRRLIENYKATKVLMVESSAQAIEHASENGFIS
jgi:phosphatidate phosphatase APP1